MSYALLVVLYGIYTEKIAGSGDFRFLSGEDFRLLDHTNFLLLGA